MGTGTIDKNYEVFNFYHEQETPFFTKTCQELLFFDWKNIAIKDEIGSNYTEFEKNLKLETCHIRVKILKNTNFNRGNVCRALNSSRTNLTNEEKKSWTSSTSLQIEGTDKNSEFHQNESQKTNFSRCQK